MNKHAEYAKLVDKVNNCRLCDGITASSRSKVQQIGLEHVKLKHVNLWSYWQGDLSPEILVIGQDWGSLPTDSMMDVFTNSAMYRANIIKGKNPTDNNLLKIFSEVFSVDILKENKLFFTNSVFCYKKGNLNENVSNSWFDQCNSSFMASLINILSPKCIVALGEKALRGLSKSGSILYNDGAKVKVKNVSLTTIVEDSNQMWWVSYDGNIRIRLFPVFHTGAHSNINRPLEKQIRDWKRVQPFVSFSQGNDDSSVEQRKAIGNTVIDHITTYTGEDIKPLSPDTNQIHIEDIAHALSLMCRANGHFSQFYSVAQHSINCANEAKARGLSRRVQLACLLHDASEAYLSDITSPVKNQMPNYLLIEKRLQDIVYAKYLGSALVGEEEAQVSQIDHDMLICEFNALMAKEVFSDCPSLNCKPSFVFCDFKAVEDEFISMFMERREEHER